MASPNRQEIPSDQEPTLPEIVVGGQDYVRPDTAEVSLEESTGGSSRQPCSQNNTDRPASRQSANARNEEPPTPSPPTPNAPRGAASSTKAKGIWCDGCIERKSQKSDVGRSRKNAKWGCEDCARLKAEAGQSRNRQRSSTPRQARPETGNSRPSQPITPQIARRKWERRNKRKTPQADLWKRWVAPAASEQQQQQNGGFNPGTDSDDPDNLPKPVADNNLLDRFGQRKDHAESTRQIRENRLQENVQPPVAANSNPDFLDNDEPVYSNNDGPGVPAASPASRQSTVLPRSMTPSGNPIRTQYPAGLMEGPIQIADERDRPPPHFEDHLRAMPNHPHMTYAPSPVPVTASGPQQQQHGGRPVAYARHPGFLGTPSRRNEFQGNADIASFSQYPDPTEFERRPTYFDDAMNDMARSMASEALHHSQWQSTGVPGSHDIARNEANFPSNYGASSSSAQFDLPSNYGASSSSAQFDFFSTPGRMNPQPADSSGYQRHPGLRPESRDRMLSGALLRPAAPQVPATLLAPSGLGATNNSQNNVDPGEVEARQAMLNQYIN